MPLISVVTPVYKVERFIEKCARTLMSQTLEDVEFIFVDDASPDASLTILKHVLADFPERNARIITHETNKGLPSSRKTGISAATGEYIFNCDGDDWVEPDLLESLYAAAKSSDADLVYCDFYLTYEKNERYMSNPTYHTPDEFIRKGLLSGGTKHNVWNKLFRRSLYEGIEFPVEHFKGGEDMIVLELAAKAKRIAYVPRALYHYIKINTGAISEGFSPQRIIDVKYNADHAIAALEKGYPTDLSTEIAFFKLNVKLPFIVTDSDAKYQVWRDWYPEANKFIWENKIQPLRNRVLQWMAWKSQWWYVKLYYKFVYKLVYGRLFH